MYRSPWSEAFVRFFFQRDHESGDSTGKAGRLSECFTAEKSKNRGSVAGDSSRIADEQSLLIMDILVRFEDGTYCNVEVQKIGYAFPGERSACYSSDLLLRQYKTARSRKKEKFTYKDVKGVYTIILMDKSARIFDEFSEKYVHTFRQGSDTGLAMDLLQNYIFIPLDIFRENVHNKGIKNKLDAWLVFLSMDEPERIIDLITAYPEFKAMYEHVYSMCRNVEDAMGIFSEELKILDRNTVRYMVDEMQEYDKRTEGCH